MCVLHLQGQELTQSASKERNMEGLGVHCREATKLCAWKTAEL